jgi:hypothetical protein
MTMKDTTVQKRASVHEKTVQAVATGAVAPTPRRARKAPQKRSGAVTHTKVDPAVWKRAQELIADARNYYSTIEVVSEKEVVVR